MTSSILIRHWVATTPQEIWRAYTTPELFHQFFAPDGLHIPLETVVMDLRVGGRFDFDMVFDHSGEVSPNRGFVVELDPPNRLVFREPDFMGSELRSTQSFTAEGSGTLISVLQEGVPDELVGNPEVLEAFRSCYRKLGRLLGVETENRD
ncbi:MAG: hypothetical protein B7C54_03650 [Acidimicrobiales bacterium mtb01]|nr:hypothetical protein [Actinomycetota bacterium]TEX47385.1 MAG: hypothetical protein B7C54_03650 [Acidimicrobiales bacterium mtb01]